MVDIGDSFLFLYLSSCCIRDSSFYCICFFFQSLIMQIKQTKKEMLCNFIWENKPQFSLLFTAVLIVSIQPYSVIKPKKKQKKTKYDSIYAVPAIIFHKAYTNKRHYSNYRHCIHHNTTATTKYTTHTQTFTFTLSLSTNCTPIKSNRMDNELSFLV